MGSLFGGTKTTTTAAQSSGPASAALPYINQQTSGAQSAYNANAAAGPFQGPYYASVTPGQTAAAQNTTNFGNTSGQALTSAGANGLSTLYGNAGNYSTNAEGLATNPNVGALNGSDLNSLNAYGSGAQSANLVSSPLSSALQNSAISGTQALQSAQGTLGTVASTALQNPTSQLATDASTYMNSAPIQSAINSTNAQINQTLGLNQAANNANEAQAGDVNSSRAGMEQALTNQAAGIAEGQADSSIQNNAYNTGLNTAATTYEDGLNTANSAATNSANAGLSSAMDTANLQNNMGQYNTSTQLGAANSALSQQLASEGLTANTQLNANSQLGQGIFDSALGTGNVMNAAGTNANLMGASGTLSQANSQAQDNAALQQYTENQTQPYSNLANYQALTANAYGTQGTNTQTQQAQGSTLGGILSLASMAAAPFTGGASLAGMAGGGLSSLFGAASGASGLASAAGSGLFA